MQQGRCRNNLSPRGAVGAGSGGGGKMSSLTGKAAGAAATSKAASSTASAQAGGSGQPLANHSHFWSAIRQDGAQVHDRLPSEQMSEGMHGAESSATAKSPLRHQPGRGSRGGERCDDDITGSSHSFPSSAQLYEQHDWTSRDNCRFFGATVSVGARTGVKTRETRARVGAGMGPAEGKAMTGLRPSRAEAEETMLV